MRHSGEPADMEFSEIIEQNRQRFLEFNLRKYGRFQDLIPNPSVRKVINAIPLLLSLNHRKIPGYVEGPVPFGIANYQPDEDAKKFLRARFPGAPLDFSAGGGFIEMLAVMGSIGTVAYNKKSDFDYWVCIQRHSITDEMYANFLRKVDEIQKWAMKEIEIPVHLFVNDIDKIRENIFAEDDDEAFGTTVGAMLKDEFFRSSIIIAGKIPFWWVVPHFIRDDEYESFYERLPDEMREKQYVDIGNLYEISRDNFLGSALFQIIKSLGNPFKSIIKIGVLEKYLFSDANALLSHRLKMSILHGAITDIMLDSYLFMFEEVYSYYSSTLRDEALLGVLKQNLYLKVDPQISRYSGVKDKKNIPYKVGVMFSYVRQWGWNMEMIRDLDNFDNWDFNRVMSFWDNVKRFILLSYQRISSQMPAMNLEKKISESDFMLLSRKITTHFRRQPGKIDQHITFKDTPSESILYLEAMNPGVKESEWRLSKRDRSAAEEFTTTTIKSGQNILDLLAWMAINNIYDPNFSRLNIQSGYVRLNQNSVTELLNEICSFFSGKHSQIRNDYFLRGDFKLMNMVIINFNQDNVDTIRTIHHLYLTSWGEAYLKEYASENDLQEILCGILRDGMINKVPFENYCRIITPESYKKHYKRIINLFRESYAALIGADQRRSVRFIAQIGDRYAAITRDGDTIEHISNKSLRNLLTAVSLKPKQEIAYRIHGEGYLERLELIYRTMKRNAITLATDEIGDHIAFYLINEKGNLFVCFKPVSERFAVLSNIYYFSRKIAGRINSAAGRELINADGFRLLKTGVDNFNTLTILNETQKFEESVMMKKNADSGLSVTIAGKAGSEALYNFRFGESASSGFVPLKELHTIVGWIRSIQKNAASAIVLIGDVMIDGDAKSRGVSDSTPYFLEKYKLEFLIEKYLREC